VGESKGLDPADSREQLPEMAAGGIMETGFYRCAQPEISTDDWIKLNFVPINTSVFELLADSEYIFEELNRIDLSDEPEEPAGPSIFEPEEPDPAEYEITADYYEALAEYTEDHKEWLEESNAHAAWQEAHEEWESDQQLNEWPAAWGTMWCARNDDDLVAALTASGFVVYETSGRMEIFGEIIFGVDGAGYDFYGSHWVPLRARMARSRHDGGYLPGEDYSSLLNALSGRINESGEDLAFFLTEHGTGVAEMSSITAVIDLGIQDKFKAAP